jgi:hypothetical protein
LCPISAGADKEGGDFSIYPHPLFPLEMSPVLFLSFRPVATLAPIVLLSGEVHQHGRAVGYKANDGGRRRDERGGIARAAPTSRIVSLLASKGNVETFDFALPNAANYSTHHAEYFSAYLTENKRWVYQQSDTLF